MRITSIYKDENKDTTTIVLDDGKETVELLLNPFYKIPRACMDINFKTIDEVKEVCLKAQALI